MAKRLWIVWAAGLLTVVFLRCVTAQAAGPAHAAGQLREVREVNGPVADLWRLLLVEHAGGPVAQFANGRGGGGMRADFPGTPRGQPSPETTPIRPPFHRLTNCATGPMGAPAADPSHPRNYSSQTGHGLSASCD